MNTPHYVRALDVANACSVSVDSVLRWSKQPDWPKGIIVPIGKQRAIAWDLNELPFKIKLRTGVVDIQAKVTLHLIQTGQIKPSQTSESAPKNTTVLESAPHEWSQQDSERLWEWASCCSQKLRDEGEARAKLLFQVDALLNGDLRMKVRPALRIVAESTNVPEPTLRRWWYNGSHRGQIDKYPKSDWAALLIPSYSGCVVVKEIPAQAWDWFTAYHLNRKQPSLEESYRRTKEAAQANNWGAIPSKSTFSRRLEEIPQAQRIYLREGAEALGKIFPPQRRDKSMVEAGEIVNGDGLKFDTLWVRFPDGEIINTATGWFWQDVRTNKILAHRLAKTENTDLFRLATYDLTAICVPRIAIIDNTRVAANKAMTGRANGRHRFKNRPDDPLGLLQMVGIEPQFTNPDKVTGSPGAKPVERAFGIGGIHSKVTTHPKFLNRGFSQKTAIDFDEFREVVAEEVLRFNAQMGRKTAICRGVLSYDQAFNESFAPSEVRRLSETQRNLLLLMPEVVRCDSRTGEIRLKAGSGPWGAHRYWDESLVNTKGSQVMVFYDPENLTKDVAVHGMNGKFITTAQHQSDIPVITTTDSREFHKQKARFIKSNKKAGQALSRMNDIAAYYPAPDDVQIPEPGIIRPNFGMSQSAVDGVVIDRSKKVVNGLSEDVDITTDELFILNMLDYQSKRTEEDY